MKRIQGAVALLYLLSLAMSPVQAATVVVNTETDEIDGGGDCSLREAIKAFSLQADTDGCDKSAGSPDYGITDAIELVDGLTYLLNIGVGFEGDEDTDNDVGDLDFVGIAPLTIRVENEGRATIADDQDRRILHLSGDIDVTIIGVTIQDGDAEVGGGILLDTDDESLLTLMSLTLQDCRVTGNVATDGNGGGGIFINSDQSDTSVRLSLTLDNTEVTGNQATGGRGGGIGSTGNSDLNVDESPDVFLIIRNNSRITNNFADRSGGGIYLASRFTASVDITDSTVQGNRSSASVASADIDETDSMGGGGGLWLSAFSEDPDKAEAFLSITGSVFDGNTVDGANGQGGGIGVLGDSATVDVRNTEITNNLLSGGGELEAGGGIAVFGALKGESNLVVTIDEGTTITDNKSDGSAGGAFFKLGTIEFSMDSDVNEVGDATISIANTTIDGNEAKVLGGLGVRVAVEDTLIELDIQDSTISNNKATGDDLEDGGGALGVDGVDVVTITRSSIFGNSGQVAGGVIFIGDGSGTETASIVNSTIYNNSATDGDSGGIVFVDFLGEIINSTIAGNSATGDGGGLSVTMGSTVSVENTILANNTADGFSPNCLSDKSTLSSNGGNIISNALGCEILLGSSDQVTDPLLGDLDESDSTPGRQTLPLGAGSPAIDAANADTCADNDELNQDQILGDREDISGEGRDGDDFQCDVGAREFLAVVAGGGDDGGDGGDDGGDATEEEAAGPGLCISGGCGSCTDQAESPFTASLRGGELVQDARVSFLWFALVTIAALGLMRRRVKVKGELGQGRRG